jgi:hypothetical protein
VGDGDGAGAPDVVGVGVGVGVADGPSVGLGSGEGVVVGLASPNVRGVAVALGVADGAADEGVLEGVGEEVGDADGAACRGSGEGGAPAVTFTGVVVWLLAATGVGRVFRCALSTARAPPMLPVRSVADAPTAPAFVHNRSAMRAMTPTVASPL